MEKSKFWFIDFTAVYTRENGLNYIAVGRTSDVSLGSIKCVTADGKKILLANVAGSFFAMQAKCPHLGGDLCKGKLDGKSLICPNHSAAFDLASGQPVAPAKFLFLKSTPKNAATYPVKVESDQIYVGI